MTRPIPLLLGLLVLLSIWLGPLQQLLQRSFAAHMAVHMGTVAVAAPLLALGVAGGVFDPVRRAPALFPAVPASIVELLVVWAWHAPALHQLARHSLAGLVLEQSTFLASGLWVWMSALGGDAQRGGSRAGLGLLALLLTSMHMTLLGALLALPPRALYAHAHHAGIPGLTGLEDQHLGGAIMLIVGGASYLAGGLWLSACLLRARRSSKLELQRADAMARRNQADLYRRPT